MQRKNILIPLFILAFAGVALLGATQVWATCNLCNSAEIADNECIEAFGYVIRIHPENNAWPIPKDGGTILEWRYRGCVKNVAECKGKTWNYFVMEMHRCAAESITDTIPPGAQLLLPGDTVPKCSNFTAEAAHKLVKLNPSLNCGLGNEVIFSYFTISGVPAGPNRTVVTTKKGCEPYDPFTGFGEILGPWYDSTPYSENISFCGAQISVTRNECTGAPDCVEIIGKQAQLCEPVICFGHPGLGDCVDLVRTNHKAGPASTGAVLDCDPPIYGYGAQYWCESPEGTPPCPE